VIVIAHLDTIRGLGRIGRQRLHSLRRTIVVIGATAAGAAD
jgi:hypothetical protein